ncbi:hypothetical protein [Methanolacinia paynteri]|uniref:hypothetical protein n=1 Tax=Methanolacinia paynteri TaxID=230356 RepID=UPI00064F5C0B|nr:hypothetical protein [Methanolacinia paynteri]
MQITDFSAIITGLFTLFGVVVGFALKFLYDNSINNKIKKRYQNLFISDLNSLPKKIDELMRDIEKEKGHQRMSNFDRAFNRNYFDDLFRFYDMNYDKLSYFDSNAEEKISKVYDHIKNAKDYFENKQNAGKSYYELDCAIKSIDTAINSLK